MAIVCFGSSAFWTAVMPASMLLIGFPLRLSLNDCGLRRTEVFNCQISQNSRKLYTKWQMPWGYRRGAGEKQWYGEAYTSFTWRTQDEAERLRHSQQVQSLPVNEEDKFLPRTLLVMLAQGVTISQNRAAELQGSVSVSLASIWDASQRNQQQKSAQGRRTVTSNAEAKEILERLKLMDTPAVRNSIRPAKEPQVARVVDLEDRVKLPPQNLQRKYWRQ